MSAKSEMQVFYETYIEPLETPEFVEWFEAWYCPEAEYWKHTALRDTYLSERRFALFGWLAAKGQAPTPFIMHRHWEEYEVRGAQNA